MKRSEYLRQAEEILDQYGAKRRLHPNTWRILTDNDRGYITIITSCFRECAQLELDMSKPNEQLDELLPALLPGHPHSGGNTGPNWTVYGIAPSQALEVLKLALRLELDPHRQPIGLSR